MLFHPKEYPSLEALLEASIFEAHSNTIINGVEVFGFVQGTAYRALYDDDGFAYSDGVAI